MVLLPEQSTQVHAFRAVMQHNLVLAFRDNRAAPTAAWLARRLGCSQAVLSKTLSGDRWMEELIQAALVSVAWRPSHGLPLPLIDYEIKPSVQGMDGPE